MGYNESQQVTTSPSTTTSTGVVTLTSTQTRVVTTFTVPSIYHQNVISMGGASTFTLGRDVYVFVAYRQLDFHVDVGQLHISYSVTTNSKIGRGVVDFWLVNDEGLHELNSTAACSMQRHEVMGIVHDFGSSAYDSTVDILSSGTYHIVFINCNQNDATITLNVDYTSPLTSVTMTEVRTVYPTQTKTITTKLMKPAGLGMPFFSGIGLVAVAVIAIAAVAMKRRGRVAQLPTTSPVARPSPPQASEGKFCINCGASLPSHATYCLECGSKQQTAS